MLLPSILKKSQITKAQAGKLIKDSGIVEIFGRYGEVRFIESYALDLMLRPDLDLWVIAENHNKEKFLKLIHDLFQANYFYEICYSNWLDKQKGKIKGYYIQPREKIDTTNWKLDVWLITKDQYKPKTEHFLELLKKEKTDEKKLLILEIKEKFAHKTKYVKGVDGNLIYKAVLEKNIKTIEEFKKFANIV